MANRIFPSMADINAAQNLLDKDIPSYRQAYSDRTAWLMSCLSELAYLRFNQLATDSAKESLTNTVERLLEKKPRKVAALRNLLDLLCYDHSAEKESLEEDLNILNLNSLKYYDEKGTQAILVSSDKFLALAFRGTEATSFSDIKADLNAKLKNCVDSDGKIHSGFSDAFDAIRYDIEKDIKEFGADDKKPLFITGHSLGGALATIATKKLNYPYIAACYTFGSPRVGNDTWVAGINPPIYRVVNAVDSVTMLPPNGTLMWFLRKLIGYLSKFLGNLAETIQGYMHAGDMRYLTNCKGEKDFPNVKLLFSVGFFYRVRQWLRRKKKTKKFISDHSISVYRKKLYFIAEKANAD